MNILENEQDSADFKWSIIYYVQGLYYNPLEGVLSLSVKFYLLSFGLETLPENHLKSGWSILSTDRAHSNNNSNGS